jgi:hypothetical protein
MSAMGRLDQQAITGVESPRHGEALIREVWATIATNVPATTLARKLISTVILAPIGWLLIAPVFAMRFLGFLPGLSFLTVKYTLTNRRLMVRKGMKPKPVKEIPLNEIGEVRVVSDANSDFYVTGKLEILHSDGSVGLTLPGVPEPESFRQTILQARDAWGPMLR